MNPSSDFPFTRIALARRAVVAEHLPGWREGSILEIGAFDNPTFVRPESDVRYLDWFSKRELVQKHRKNRKRRVELAVDVDYVVKGGPLSKAVGRSFDLVVAHHVLEHIPDPIGWLVELGGLTSAGGHLFLTIPDRRFTFDFDREETDVVELLRCHDERLVRPSYYQVLRDLYYHRAVKLEEAHAGKVQPHPRPRRLTLCEAMDQARLESQGYRDSHCHVFTSESFRVLWHDLATAGLVPWIDVTIGDTRAGENEFPVLLRRC